jgi:hypothetical protein
VDGVSVLPLTYGVDILKAAVNQERILPLQVSFAVLLFFTAGLFLLLPYFRCPVFSVFRSR